MNLKLRPSPGSPVRLAILECDTPLPETGKQYGGYGGVFKALLTASAKAEGYDPAEILDISMWQVELEPEKYPVPEDIDAILITGSRHDAFADTPWINTLVAYTARVLTTTPVRAIGVCFGHQIIGRALHCDVDRNPNGWEAAVNTIDLNAAGQKVFSAPQSLSLHQMHRDAVLSLPKPPAGVATVDVQILASSPVCHIQSLYRAAKVLTVQGHPEFDEPIMREIVQTRHATGIFDDVAYNEHIGKVALPHDGLVVGKGFVKFLLD